MPIGKEATFWDHLEELRGVAVRGVAITAVIAVRPFCSYAQAVYRDCDGTVRGRFLSLSYFLHILQPSFRYFRHFLLKDGM